jgi:hypothetical protein
LLASPVLAQEADLAVLPTLVTQDAGPQFPALFDEFLLTAVQDTARVPVIGKDDIDAVLGFERTKELMGCDDVSCMADIGGALGVSRLVHAKVDKLDGGSGNWVITTKLIISAGPTVESRTSDFVTGNSQALLQAVPGVVRKLFAGGGVGTGPTSPRPTPEVATPPPSPVDASTRVDESYGAGSRTVGIVIAVAGVAAGIAGLAVAVTGSADVTDTVLSDCGDFKECFDLYRGDYLEAVAPGIVVTGAGLAAFGLGQRMYLNGRAAAYTSNDDAIGRHSLTWLGWVLAGVTVVFPLLDAAVGLEPLGVVGGVGGMLGSMGVFTYTMLSSSAYYSSPKTGATYPMARLLMLRDRSNHMVPAYGLAVAF